MQCLAILRPTSLRQAKKLHSRSSRPADQYPPSLRRLTASFQGRQRSDVSSKSATPAPHQPTRAVVATQEVEQLTTPSKTLDKPTEATDERLEKFIPITRRALLRALVEEKGLLSSEEKRLMQNVAAALDAKYSKKFYSILEQAKSLYDVMDPDKDTFQTRVFSRKEILDNEYYLLQKVEKLLHKANFFEITREKLLSLLHDRDTSGVIVSVDSSEYELLRIWTRGQEIKRPSLYSHMKSFAGSLLKPREGAAGAPSTMVHTRVFLAVRSTGDKKLHLKVFKEIRADKLEHLLPKGKLKMSTFDKWTLVCGVLLGACLPFTRIFPLLSDLKIQWIWGGVGLAGLMAGRAWISYKNKRNRYLASLATTLYFKIVANNRGVLTLLTDRAQDEEFKEALLAYTFLLCPAKSDPSDLPIYDSPQSLQHRIEQWLKNRFQLKDFHFDIDDALSKLDELGLLVMRRNGSLTTVSIPDALSVLPAPSERWLVVGARRDSQSMDEQMTEEEESVDKKRKFVSGWS